MSAGWIDPGGGVLDLLVGAQDVEIFRYQDGVEISQTWRVRNQRHHG